MIRFFVLFGLLLSAACSPVVLTDRINVDAFEYRIGSGDKLKVTTYGEERLSGDFTVNSAGAIAFPLVGDVMAKGKTLSEFTAQLRSTLGSEYVRNPQVSVETSWKTAIYDTFFVQSANPALAAKNLWIQDAQPTLASDVDAVVDASDKLSNTACDPAKGA